MDRGRDSSALADELLAPLLLAADQTAAHARGQHAPKTLESAVMATVILPTMCSDLQKPGSR